MKRDVSEAKLIKLILAGDEPALRRFWRLYTPKLLAFIQAKINNPTDAEEILQDTLLVALEGLRDFEGKSALLTYLCAIANHKVIDYYRKRRVKQVFLSQLPEEVLPLVSAFLAPEDEFDAKEVQLRINQVLKKLKPDYRRVLLLKYIDGLSVKEIASLFQVTVKSAESTLFRARITFVKVYNAL